MTTVTLSTTGEVVEPPQTPVVRLTASADELALVSSLCGVESPVAEMLRGGAVSEALGERLGATAAVPEPSDPDEVLAGAVQHGLVTTEGEPEPALAAALALWHGADLAVEFDLLVQIGAGRARVRSWHRAAGGRVVCVSTVDGLTTEVSWLAVEDWWKEIARVVVVPPAPDKERAVGTELPRVVETPWELLLGTGEAVVSGRGELARQMVDDHTGLVRGGDVVGGTREADDQQALDWLATLAAPARARMHAVVLARGTHRPPGAAVVEWVLHADRWRSLTPYVDDGWRMVRVAEVDPVDLSGRVAALAAEVMS
ncbi:MAG: hypothetical protein ACI379_16520 [Nocardioides sp.]|uniref:hypothetical protein n=1 Tax=Nocardioides sp. TaxID=35761 RepID=UPI003F07A997